jgi:hypothetical protein
MMNGAENVAEPASHAPETSASQGIREYIAHADFHQAAIRELAGLLPADDAALGRIIGEAVARSEDVEFTLIEFSKAFSQTLEVLPRHVARSTMIMIGRLAAGEPGAFVGALRLKATPNVMRQRIGSGYRLLFRLWPERLEVIDLINRKDLGRRIKTLV